MSLPDYLSTRQKLLYFLQRYLVPSLAGGSDREVQYNNAGSLGASANLTWTQVDSINFLNVTGAVGINSVLDPAAGAPTLWVTGAADPVGRVGIGTDAPEAYLDIKNTVDDGTTNRTMLRLHNYRPDDADVNDFGPISIDFEIFNDGYGGKSGLARIAAVECPIGTDHSIPAGEYTSGLIFSTMDNEVLAEAMRIDAEGHVGIGTTDPLVALDIHHNPTGLSNDTGGGDVVTFGAGPGGGSTTAGKLYYLAADGQWELADADAAATGGTQLLAIALGTTPGTHGMLIRGFFDVYTNLNGTFAAGKPVYVCPDSGEFDIDAPGDAGDIVRVVGYCTSTANVIYFNPSSTYIEIS